MLVERVLVVPPLPNPAELTVIDPIAWQLVASAVGVNWMAKTANKIIANDVMYRMKRMPVVMTKFGN